jgi:OOP family OmpA-OmpF porin
VAGLDVVRGKPVANQMVLVKAEEMAKALDAAGKVDLYGIYFDSDKSDLKPDSNATLEEIARLLKSDAALKLEVGGHTDNTGTAARNLTLSQQRAAAVVKALTTSHGIAAPRLAAKGYGDARPVSSNADEAGRSKNRRVELRKM